MDTVQQIESAKANLKKIPFAARERLQEALSSAIEKAKRDKLGRKVERLEKGMTRYLAREWKKSANRATSSALKVISQGSGDTPVTKKQAERMVKNIERAFKGFDKKVSSRVSRDTEQLYRANKTRFVQRFELEPVQDGEEEKQLVFKTVTPLGEVQKKVVKSCQDVTKVDPTLIALYTAMDTNIVNQLVNLTMISIGDHFPKTLKPTVTKKIIEGVHGRGLNKAQASDFLKTELTKVLGSTNQTVPPAIRKLGQERTNAYFKGLVDTNGNFARNFSQTTAMDEAEIAQYEVVAIMDNLTSQICRQMDGRVFELRYAVQHRNDVLEMENVEQLKEYAPWRDSVSEIGVKPGSKNTPKAQEVLAANGMAMPPYHFRCRTEVHPA